MRRIELRDVTRRFDDVVAVDGVELTVEPGVHLAALGPSGSGKSTLLRLVAGLDEPDQGAILLDGADQRNIPPHQRDVALVFQQYALYPHLSALRNITTGLRYGLGLSRSDAEARAREVASGLGIEDLLGRKPRAMSGGQRQRVALARALARRAGVVLLDEPLSGLDAQLRASLRVQISASLREAGATVLHVTHDQADAMTAADLIAVMREGRLEQVGPPDEVYEKPATLFVATFVGTPPMNLFPTTPMSERPLVLGVRPADLRVGDGAWRGIGTVAAVEHAGHERIVHLMLRGELAALRTAASDARPAVGDRMPVTVDPALVHVFDPATTRRLGDAASLAVPPTALSLSPPGVLT